MYDKRQTWKQGGPDRSLGLMAQNTCFLTDMWFVLSDMKPEGLRYKGIVLELFPPRIYLATKSE